MATIKFENGVTVEDMTENEFKQAFSSLVESFFNKNEQTLTYAVEPVDGGVFASDETWAATPLEEVEDVSVNGKGVSVKKTEKEKSVKIKPDKQKKKTNGSVKKDGALLGEPEIAEDLLEDLKGAKSARSIAKRFLDHGFKECTLVEKTVNNLLERGMFSDALYQGDSLINDVTKSYKEEEEKRRLAN